MALFKVLFISINQNNKSLFSGFKTIVYDKKKGYFDDFSETGKTWGQSTAKSQFLILAPRNLLEFFAFQ